MSRRWLLIPLVCSALTLCACSSLPQPRDSLPTDTPAPASNPVSRAEPADVLREFVRAWNSEDFEAMHRLIAGRSRELFPRQIFINRYTQAHSEMSFAGVSHRLGAVSYQGTTAILDYDINIESPTFGRIQDPGRRMRMVDEGGWKIAWSTMDIFDALSSRARLRADTQFPIRADILDRESQPLAEEAGTIISLYVSQNAIGDLDDCLATLAVVTRQQINTLRNIFANYLAETLFHIAEIDPETYQRYRDDLAFDCGIASEAEDVRKVFQYRGRRYVGHGIATHVVGYIGAIPSEQLQYWVARGYQATDLVGRAGIEFAFEETLAGKPQRSLLIVAQGSDVLRELATSPGAAPNTVTLTIDRGLQAIMAGAIADAFNQSLLNWGGISLGGAIVALDVNSGEVLALASYPSFDPHIFHPNTRYNVADRTARLNRDVRAPFTNKALAEQYTPGSVYKIVTLLAAASDPDIWDPGEDFFCDIRWEGQVNYGDAIPVRYDWRLLENLPPSGWVDMSRALATSCNPFFWEVGARMYQKDPDMQSRYAEQLGFGSATGLQHLGNEAAGDVAYPQSGESTEAINNAIGQGNVTVSALQMAAATAAIANGGSLWQPYVVSHIGGLGRSDYQLVQQKTLKRQLDLDEAALAIVRQGMCDVTSVENVGTAWFVFDDAPYELCGKTGTAQTAGQPHAWFVAYYPAQDPQIAFAGVMTNSREGSEVVAPLIRRILDDYLGLRRAPYPEWWGNQYVALPSQAEALADYDPEA